MLGFCRGRSSLDWLVEMLSKITLWCIRMWDHRFVVFLQKGSVVLHALHLTNVFLSHSVHSEKYCQIALLFALVFDMLADRANGPWDIRLLYRWNFLLIPFGRRMIEFSFKNSMRRGITEHCDTFESPKTTIKERQHWTLEYILWMRLLSLGVS